MYIWYTHVYIVYKRMYIIQTLCDIVSGHEHKWYVLNFTDTEAALMMSQRWRAEGRILVQLFLRHYRDLDY